MKIDISTVKSFIANKELKSLGFALLIKDMYQSSTITNYTVNSLKNKLKQAGFGISAKTIKKHISILDREGLIVNSENHLTIKKLHTERSTVNIKKKRATSLNEYTHFLRGALLKDKMLKARFIQNKISLSNKKMANPRSVKDIKSAKNTLSKFDKYTLDERGFVYKESINSFCKEFNCSIESVYATLNCLKEKGLKVKKNIKRLGPDLGVRIPNTFSFKGSVYIVEANNYYLPLL